MVDYEYDAAERELDAEITTEIRTDTSYEGEGDVHAVLIMRQAHRRLDWRLGHYDDELMSAYDLYHEGELLHQGEWDPSIAEGVHLGDNGDTIYHIEDMEVTDDGDIEYTYDDGEDAVEWAALFLTGRDHETLLNEIWYDMKLEYDEGTL